MYEKLNNQIQFYDHRDLLRHHHHQLVVEHRLEYSKLTVDKKVICSLNHHHHQYN